MDKKSNFLLNYSMYKNKKLLLHTCCAPCFAYPLKFLKENTDFDNILTYFNNPNIHPYKEFKKRKEAFEKFCEAEKIEFLIEDYGLYDWLKYVYDALKSRRLRCEKCYEMRLTQTAKKAQELGIKTISTTLLYSTYQYHDLIKKIGERIAANFGLEFFYHDFRCGWEQGFNIFRPYKEKGLHMQNYCGCVFSKEERFRENR